MIHAAATVHVRQCKLEEACVATANDNGTRAVRGGATRHGNETASRLDYGDNICARGYGGPLCDTCKLHYYRDSLSRRCESCMLVRQLSSFTIVLLALGALLFVSLVSYVVILCFFEESDPDKVKLYSFEKKCKT